MIHPPVIRLASRSLSTAALAGLFTVVAAEAHAQELLVSGFTSDAVHRYDYATGASLGHHVR